MGKKTIYFDSFCGYTIAAVTENGKVVEFGFEKNSTDCAVGNVYKGVVESVHKGMQAAFINCGLERNCFLPLIEENPHEADKIEGGSVQTRELSAGDEVLVQVLKLPAGNKGAKVTMQPSLVGKCLIYTPETPFVGVSRKIKDEELRRNLAFSAKRLKEDGEGIIFRTAAPYAKRQQLKDEYSYLKNLYAEIKENFKQAAAGELLYADASIAVRVLRDTISTDIDEIHVGSAKLKERVEGIVNLYPAQTRRPVILHNSGRDMFAETGIAEQILAVASPRVNLDNGAYIIIEKTEALTVIDVNTGKFTGDYSLEQTVYHTNIEAAREIARQVKLRNIGGIIVVDFIDMQSPAHNKALVEELERSLKADKSKCVVSPMSQFGLVEFTRKRTGVNPVQLMIKPCKYCGTSGYTLTFEYILIRMRAKILDYIADGVKSLRLDMNADVFSRLNGWREFLNDLNGLGAEIYAVPHRTYHEELIRYKPAPFDIPDDAVKLT
ncbi:MAG: Rne/Rng family ribonuclease [Clostridia bacterium]|nr:Rne/Rng family ribonuclease [Clostridia bacterium]